MCYTIGNKCKAHGRWAVLFSVFCYSVREEKQCLQQEIWSFTAAEGVCRVESVGMPETEGIDKTKAYYTLSPLYRTGQVMTPVDTGVLMRR